mmetsp:Transcript_41973/g.127268  ORF Transcript_41973/g.127268 Transcript_41973/m.127268 type:complete len:293 (-) Transcript_41973:56-934(-)
MRGGPSRLALRPHQGVATRVLHHEGRRGHSTRGARHAGHRATPGLVQRGDRAGPEAVPPTVHPHVRGGGRGTARVRHGRQVGRRGEEGDGRIHHTEGVLRARVRAAGELRTDAGRTDSPRGRHVRTGAGQLPPLPRGLVPGVLHPADQGPAQRQHPPRSGGAHPSHRLRLRPRRHSQDGEGPHLQREGALQADAGVLGGHWGVELPPGRTRRQVLQDVRGGLRVRRGPRRRDRGPHRGGHAQPDGRRRRRAVHRQRREGEVEDAGRAALCGVQEFHSGSSGRGAHELGDVHL